MAEHARPTLRCLRDDLGLAVPHVDILLEEIRHPLLAKATERFADDGTPQERIAAIDDQVLFKVKVQRWRGAVWVDAGIPWLVAAGQREEGSPDDFYASLAARGKTARARYNAEHSPPLTTTTYTDDLLPERVDELRWRAEAAARTDRCSYVCQACLLKRAGWQLEFSSDLAPALWAGLRRVRSWRQDCCRLVRVRAGRAGCWRVPGVRRG